MTSASQETLWPVFVSTYGQGEPTDNAVGLTQFLKTEESVLSNGGTSLEHLMSCILALGNSTYEQFCKIAKNINNALNKIWRYET